ncbi:GAP family protein [Gulosibacter sp. 10]|uniref:GAP family protein n=1 Tax=Gulosibacter sp. 10 TaxID=1255570 RepID=UPI00097F2399|nr:GAP family protein [Gulosibacter sp. 10]SJM63662.1 membrane protein, putative [Gulosibacter sp. 10]
MDIALLASAGALVPVLIGLALVDSLSYGTFAVPVWLLMTPGRVRAFRLLAYLLAIGGFYFVVGLVLLAGAGWIVPFVEGLAALPVVPMLGLAGGIALVWWSFALDSEKAKARRAERGGGTRIARWRRIAMGDDAEAGPAGAAGTAEAARAGADPHRGTGTGTATRSRSSVGALMGLAVVAGLAEVATMIPYLAAIGLLTTSDLGWPTTGWMLAGYCLVMLLPALVMLLGRLLFAQALRGPLERLDRWFAKHAESAFAWIVGIVGAVLIINCSPAVF